MDGTAQVTPVQLRNEINQLIAENTGCKATWEQHPQALTVDELLDLRAKIYNSMTQRIVGLYLETDGAKLR